MENWAHNALAVLLITLFSCAPSLAQPPVTDMVGSGENLLSPGSGDPGQGADVFGITDLIGSETGDSNSGLSADNGCEGFQCDQTTLFELPGLESEESRENAETGECRDSDKDGVCDTRDACLGSPASAPVLDNGCGLQPGNPIILSGVRFASGSAQLNTAAKSSLSSIISLIKSSEAPHIVVEGHTDDNGSEEANLALSEARAKAVYQYLISNGIAENRLAFVGRGEAFPLVPHRTSSGQRLPGVAEINRRMELTVTAPETFAALRTAMREREQRRQEKIAQEARLREEKAAQIQAAKERAESAEESYDEVLEFLEETGTASRDDEGEAEDYSDPGYTLEVINLEE
ncbi:outer membrane protein OmpA-like peptidoglycan-associated protein [Litorivivens lipolytica]|uniref:Outer membrane protein OmpA-like peptidoglycan-associated protein n=1 Tax=Litorivivens lipolytica TaxID=1524264 RepID=A0A7W4Z669_9GAMM|nr:OmpA family protein [Litorivivens lipolytica]MBB3046621.1 outer membrane protein OmpA-like peptidoglycan-associated protein [Litorivivens lipolytica]